MQEEYVYFLYDFKLRVIEMYVFVVLPLKKSFGSTNGHVLEANVPNTGIGQLQHH